MTSPKDIVIAILALILIALTIFSFITSKLKNDEIKRLGQLNTQLGLQIGQAEASMQMQNLQIEKYKRDVENAELLYNERLQKIKDDYEDRLNQNYDNLTCQDIINTIYDNQRRFLNAK